MRQELPERFLEEMRGLLGEEADAYLASFDAPPAAGLRVNTGKWTPEEAAAALDIPLRSVGWAANGFSYEASQRLSRDPYYYAGLYYLQEPSAMAPAAFLPVKPKDRVLDLCAAPGGKSTELGTRLRGEGLLWANDISASRAKALLKNLELFGIPNICVSSETPEKLARLYPACFDAVLVDAPCSGEGMFRREPEMVKDWLARGPAYYAPVQREILSQAVTLLRPGGYLLYSTCTFSRMEDEENVLWLLAQHPEMELVPLAGFAGACGGIGLSGCLRLYPHRIAGEGHFLALMHKKAEDRCGKMPCGPDDGLDLGRANDSGGGDSVGRADGFGGGDSVGRADGFGVGTSADRANDFGGSSRGRTMKLPPEAAEFLARCRRHWDANRFLVKDGSIYYLPEAFLPVRGVRCLRTGLLVGTVKNGRFEPSQALAMTLDAETFADSVSFSHDDARVVRYLKGETVFLREDEPERQGWVLVCVEGHGLGFAKASVRTLKNKYYPAWRMQ